MSRRCDVLSHLPTRGRLYARDRRASVCAGRGARYADCERGGSIEYYSSLKGVVWGVGDLHTAQNRDAKKVSE